MRAILPLFWFVLKVFSFLFLYVWVRGTLPRFRYDQLMTFGWRFLLPLAIVNIVGTSLWLALQATELVRCIYNRRRFPSHKSPSRSALQPAAGAATRWNDAPNSVYRLCRVVPGGSRESPADTHPINSALSLVVVMSSLAVLYLLLGAEFLAIAQIIVYAGAIMVLFTFVVMLLNAGEEDRTLGSRAAKIVGFPAVAVLLGVIATVILTSARAWAARACSNPITRPKI